MKHFRIRVPAALGAILVAAGCSSAASGPGPAGAGGGDGEGGAVGVGGAGGAASEVPLVASAVAVGAAHTCAIVEGGAVACWGDGARGQLGDGGSGKGHQRVAPGLVPGLSGVTAIRAGGDTTCAVAAGGVFCWGDGAFGQLGDGMAADGYLSPVPVPVTGLAGVVDLSVNGSNACVALAGGTVRCWGRNAPEAWLGFGSEDCGPYNLASGDDPPSVMTVPCERTPREVPGVHDAAAVVAGGEHACLRAADGTARCWGADAFGQLGDGASGPDAYQESPVAVSGLMDVQRLALGASHTCAIAGAEGRVRCWGDNGFGQLGIGTNALDSNKITPTPIDGLTGVVDLAAAGRTTCAARGGGDVLCWGDTSTVLPVSPEKDGTALVPTPVPGVAGVLEARTGGAHVCARRGDGTVICWGANDRGQLGNGGVAPTDFSLQPVVAVQPMLGAPG